MVKVSINGQVEIYIKVAISMIWDTGTVRCIGLINHITKGCGKREFKMVKEKCACLTKPLKKEFSKIMYLSDKFRKELKFNPKETKPVLIFFFINY